MSAPIRSAEWSTAVPDWQDRIMQGRSMVPDLPLNDATADRAVEIFSRLRVPDLIGQPTYGEVCEQWILDFVRAIFGAYDPETRKRMIREFFLLVPKKNAKSSIAAAIIVTAAIMNVRPYAELILIAPTQQIAKISFKQAAGIIRLDEELDALFQIRDHVSEIEHRVKFATIKILSADGDVVTGSKATYILVDETHVLAAKHKAPEIFVELRGGLSSRPEGFMLQITTQSKSVPSGQFRRELKRARDVRDGKSTYPMLAVLYELPPKLSREGAWRDEATWGLVNPNLNRSVSLDYLRDEMASAEEAGPDALALFASQHLNVEIGVGLSDGWVGAEYWPRCAEPGMTLESLLDACEVAVIGADVGGADDLFGLSVLGRRRDGRGLLSWSRAWAMDLVLERRKEIAPRLQDFAEQGDLVITPDAESHILEAVDVCEQVRAAGLLPARNAIGLDPHGVAALFDELMARRFTEAEVIGVSQGYKLSGAVKGLERRLLDGKLRHAAQPMMDWCVANAKAETRGNNVYISKAAAGTAKIDPLVALFNAAMLMDMNPVAGLTSPWDDEEYLLEVG